ncbi:MAG: hypothetical protein NVS4B5_01860 [Vulcanimicrobiaceae bacterium]
MKHWIIGTFHDRASAEAAVERLGAIGYGQNDVSVVMNHETRSKYFGEEAAAHGSTDRSSSIAKGAAGGGMIGGTLGALVAAVVGTGALGLTVATGGVAAPFIAGPLAAALAAGGAGAAAGSVLGGLVGAGMPAYDAKRVDRDVEGGNIVVSVHADDEDAGEARTALGTNATL